MLCNVMIGYNSCNLIYIYKRHIIQTQTYPTKMQQKHELFKSSIKQDPTAKLKLLKYRTLIETQPSLALELRPQMLKLALDSSLIGVYRTIFEMFKENIQFTEQYQKLNAKMVEQINAMHSIQKICKAEGNVQGLAEILKKIGIGYFNYGEYKNAIEAFQHLSTLNDASHNIEYSTYASEYALCYYYRNQMYNLMKFNTRPIEKSVLYKLVDLCLIRDINNIDNRRALSTPFKNVIDAGFSNLELTKNSVISYGDLGFFYSLIILAYGANSQSKKYAKWSYGLEGMFESNRYKNIFQILAKQKQIRCNLPIIRKHYQACCTLIRKRIITQVISSFDRCPFTVVEQMTGITEPQLRLFIRNNTDIPILIDPVTSSVVYRRSPNSQLYKQVSKLYHSLHSRYLEELQSLNRPEEKEDDDDDDFRMSRKKSSGGRMGGMGRMMGRMGGMGMF